VDSLIDPGGAVLFVASRYNQLHLDHWRSNFGTGDDRVATVRGYYHGGAVGKPPWPGYAYEGTDGMLLRIPPTSAGTTVPVSLFQRTTKAGAIDYFVARSNDPRFSGTPYTNLGEEGHVYLNPADVLNPQALRLYKHKLTGDFTSTTAAVADPSYEPAPDPKTGSNLIGFIAGL
jgi:hypothetical protein